MSTWYPYRLNCPACGTEGEVQLLKGIHVSRLAAVRRDLHEGRFQVHVCPSCAHRVQLEVPSVYTDFPNGQYIAVELPFPADVAGPRARHRQVFDACFLFGPDVAADLGARVRHRLVFGVAALREKVLAWGAGLDDRIVEALKADVLAADGLGHRDQMLRLVSVLPGNHLVFARLEPPSEATRAPLPVPLAGAVPTGSPVPPRGAAPYRCPGGAVTGYVTVPERSYQRRLMDRASLFVSLPMLSDDWVVDVFDGSAQAA
jgi:hypothetical protein